MLTYGSTFSNTQIPNMICDRDISLLKQGRNRDNGVLSKLILTLTLHFLFSFSLRFGVRLSCAWTHIFSWWRSVSGISHHMLSLSFSLYRYLPFTRRAHILGRFSSRFFLVTSSIVNRLSLVLRLEKKHE
jgi:hypothetical protein